MAAKTGYNYSLDRQRGRIQAMSSVFAKTDKILTGNRAITVSFKEPEIGLPENVPAYSNGKDIVININEVKDITTKASLMTLLGLNYHELCHILFTPRGNEYYGITSWVRQQGLKMAYNVLEDQRIETLFVSMYSPARHYFIKMILAHIIEDKKGWDHAHVLVHGRRYIPKTIRDEFESRWFNPASTKEVSKIIDTYRVLDFTNETDVETAKPLITRLNAIMQQLSQQDKEKITEEHDCNQERADEGTPDSETSSSASKQAKQDTKEQDEKEEQGDDGSGFWADEDEEEEGEENDENGSGSGEDDEDESDSSESVSGDEEGEESAGDGEEEDDDESEDSHGESGDGNDDSNDEDSDSDASGKSDGGDGDSDESDSDEDGAEGGDDQGEGEGAESDEDSDSESQDSGNGVGGGGLTKTELLDEIDDILSASEESETTQEDLRQLNNAMSDPHNFDLDAESAVTELIDIPAHIRLASSRVADQFRRLYAEMEPGWKYGSDSGKLNVNRAISSEDGEDIWDEWDEGRQESSGLELVICVDVSGSMQAYGYMAGGNVNNYPGTPIAAACYSVWVMKRACEELGATVSVVGFGVDATTIIPRHAKARNDKAVYVTDLEGDTRPAEAFGIARFVLSQSDQPNKLFVVVTDGAWGVSYDHSRYVGNANVYGGDDQLGQILAEIPGTKVYLGIGKDCMPSYRKYFDVQRTIGNAEDIVPVVKAAIESMMKKGEVNGITSRQTS